MGRHRFGVPHLTFAGAVTLDAKRVVSTRLGARAVHDWAVPSQRQPQRNASGLRGTPKLRSRATAETGTPSAATRRAEAANGMHGRAATLDRDAPGRGRHHADLRPGDLGPDSGSTGRRGTRRNTMTGHGSSTSARKLKTSFDHGSGPTWRNTCSLPRRRWPSASARLRAAQDTRPTLSAGPMRPAVSALRRASTTIPTPTVRRSCTGVNEPACRDGIQTSFGTTRLPESGESSAWTWPGPCWATRPRP